MAGFQRKGRIILTVLLAGLLPTATPGTTQAEPPATPPPEAAEGLPARPRAGSRAPTFEAPDLFGSSINVPGLIQGKTALVAFWASWCQPCIQEIPHLRSLARTYRERGLVIVGVGVRQGGDTPDKQRKAAAQQLVNYQLVFDEQGIYQSTYALDSLPYTILVDPDGNISWEGNILPDDLEERIKTHIIDSRRRGLPRG